MYSTYITDANPDLLAWLWKFSFWYDTQKFNVFCTYELCGSGELLRMSNIVVLSRLDRLYQATIFSWLHTIFAVHELYFFPSLGERRWHQKAFLLHEWKIFQWGLLVYSVVGDPFEKVRIFKFNLLYGNSELCMTISECSVFVGVYMVTIK